MARTGNCGVFRINGEPGSSFPPDTVVDFSLDVVIINDDDVPHEVTIESEVGGDPHDSLTTEIPVDGGTRTLSGSIGAAQSGELGVDVDIIDDIPIDDGDGDNGDGDNGDGGDGGGSEPECSSDSDCAGDNICVQGDCYPIAPLRERGVFGLRRISPSGADGTDSGCESCR